MEFEGNYTNATSEDTLWKTSYNTYQRNPVHLTIHLIYLFLGVFLNVLTILIIVRGKRFGRRMKIQLTNLAVADLLSSFFILGGAPVKEFITLPYPDSLILCKLQSLVAYSVFYASLVCNAIIAVERFVAVYFPFLMARYKRSHVIAVTIAIWVVAFTGNINVFLAAQLFDNPLVANRKICFVTFNKIQSPGMLVFDAIKFLLPTLIVLALYAMIAIRLRSRSLGKGKASNSLTVRMQVTKMLAADGLISVAIWLPYFILVVVNVVQSQAGMELGFANDVVKAVFYELLHANCFLTPIIYFIFNKEFKREGKMILCGRWTKDTTTQESHKSTPTAATSSKTTST